MLIAYRIGQGAVTNPLKHSGARILTKLGARERAQVVIAVYEAGDIVPGAPADG